MSDIDMEMSPKGETGSDHSEGENPPTPGSYGRQDGELNSHDNSEHEESDQETKDKVTADNKGMNKKDTFIKCVEHSFATFIKYALYTFI